MRTESYLFGNFVVLILGIFFATHLGFFENTKIHDFCGKFFGSGVIFAKILLSSALISSVG